MVIETYVAESLLLRVEKLAQMKGAENVEAEIAMMNTLIYDVADRIQKNGKDALQSFAEGDELRMMLMGLRRFTKTDPLNVKEERRKISARLIAEDKYCFKTY